MGSFTRTKNKYICNKDTKLQFGKHKGRRLEDVISSDPEWVEWALHNVEWFAISKKASRYLDECISNSYDSDYDAEFRAAFEF